MYQDQIEVFPYKYQINLENPLGNKGEFVTEFAELLKKMWNSKNAVTPTNF